MVVGPLQLIGCVIGVIGGICVLITTLLPEWRRNDPSDELLDSIVRHQGLWEKCVSYPTGQWQCEDFDNFFIGLPAQLQVARGLSCSAIALGFTAFLASLVGMECTSCLTNDEKSKSKVAMLGGGLWICAGVSIGIAVSFYAHQVLSEYNRDVLHFADDIGQKYVYGTSLFVGWAALVICTIGGLLMVCGSRYEDEDVESTPPYRPAYKIPNKSSSPTYNTEYV